MQLLVECFERLKDASNDSRDPELNGLLDVLEHRFPQLWKNLWEIRIPLFESQFICAAEKCTGSPNLHGSLHAIAGAVYGVLRFYRQVDYRVPYPSREDSCSYRVFIEETLLREIPVSPISCYLSGSIMTAKSSAVWPTTT